MNTRNTQDHSIGRKFLHTLWKHGPLVTAKRVNEYLQSRLDRISGYKRLFLSIDRALYIVQRHLDSSFDRKYGIDTSGVISLKDLTIESKNIKEGIWYEPMSVKIFKRIMNHLTIQFGEFEFVDFGSGKGRVLLLASEYGYKKIIGVEFAQELHLKATENVAIYNRYTQKPSNIETICIDAADFPIPEVPVVLFFYSPFKEKVMGRVLNNVTTSFSKNPRQIMLLFYGSNPETIQLLKTTVFQWRELDLRSDWSRFTQYRCFLGSAHPPETNS